MSPRPSRVVALLVCAFVIPAGAAWGQESAEGDEKQPRPPSIFDFGYEVKDPRDLFPPERKFQNRWRRIWGALGMRYHLYPSQATGRENWPPHMFGGGWNYSIWRNPVTGWLEF